MEQLDTYIFDCYYIYCSLHLTLSILISYGEGHGRMCHDNVYLNINITLEAVLLTKAESSFLEKSILKKNTTQPCGNPGNSSMSSLQ